MATRADIRADFIKRLFAVAISVGAASSIIQMDWVKNGTFPNHAEWEHLTILGVGLYATVLSWDGYLFSIEHKPLNDYFRFAIDILLVFIYMFLLISSRKPYLWLPTLAVIFSFYVIWDMLSVREHVAQYDQSLVPAGADESYRASLWNVLKIYVRGFLDQPTTERGPITSLSWAIFFIALSIINNNGNATYQVFVACGFAFFALSLYRHDKAVKLGTNAVRGYPMIVRGLLIISLLTLAALYVCILSTGAAGLK